MFYVMIQDIRLCKDVGLGYHVEDCHELNGTPIKSATNGNPGIIYIADPLKIKVGDTFDGDKIVKIIRYPPQPTCGILYLEPGR